jgi:hypothetical protein
MRADENKKYIIFYPGGWVGRTEVLLQHHSVPNTSQ